MHIDIDSKDVRSLRVSCKYADKWRLDVLPSKAWDVPSKSWIVPIIQPNIEALRSNFKGQEFTPAAIARIKDILAKLQDDYVPFYGNVLATTMLHQRVALDKAHQKNNYFFAHAMGTGKSLTILTLASHLHQEQDLQGLLVICPASIKHDVWEREIKKWLPNLGVQHTYHVLSAGKQAKAMQWMERSDPSHLKILVAGVQALSNERQAAYSTCQEFLTRFTSGIMVDESSKIKNYKAGRTRNIIDLGSMAKWRWCGTGTKITQGIHDLYAQFRFLDWQILGHKSFITFRNRYCIMGGFEDRQIVSYKNVDELMKLIGPYIDVVRKEDANELPPKVYQTRTVKATDLQVRLFRELKTFMEANVGDEELSVRSALERMIRYQQLAGGNIPYKTPEGEWRTKPMQVNPKLDELEIVLEETSGKVIIWAVFIPEIEMITKRLKEIYGDKSTVAYYGEVARDERATAIDRFQNDPDCLFFVANPATAGMGLTLTAATTAIYYSNSFSHEDRVQSEDRNHRTGQKNSVLYIDLFIDLPIDTTIRTALEKKQSISKFVSDSLKEGKKQYLDI